MTEDSFSDGGRFLEPEAAIAQLRRLSAGGAHVVDLGAASSKPDAMPVPPALEIARLAPVVTAAARLGITVSVDSFAPEVQIWALGQGVAYLNDVRGFPDETLYPVLARAGARLIVMHSLEGLGPATRLRLPPDEVYQRIERFFEARIAALTRAGIAPERLILDPGMGFFLGTDPEASYLVLRRLKDLKARFGRPVLISVSRKSFLRKLAQTHPADAGAPTLAAELFAHAQGADMIRTHDPESLKRGLSVWRALAGTSPGYVVSAASPAGPGAG